MPRNYDTKKIVDLRSRKILIWCHGFNRILIFKSQSTELFKPASQLENVQIYHYCFSNFTIINFLPFTSFRNFVPHANLWKVCEIYKINVRSWERIGPHQKVKVFPANRLFSLYVLFSCHFRPGDGTPKNCLNQINVVLYVCIHVHNNTKLYAWFKKKVKAKLIPWRTSHGLNCVVPENIQTPTTEGISLRTPHLPRFSIIFAGIWWPPTPSEFPQVWQSPPNPYGKVHFHEERLSQWKNEAIYG